ncbi:MAG: adenylosuccinate lyase [Clostridiales bacterium]|nr:adenylosuccinate lyase [Clostridiales bacterium]
MKDVYENPLITRYADRKTAEIFSDDNKFKLWRRLWIALAESEKELGLDISDAQIAEMKKYANDINYDYAEKEEKIVRHDVMAHVHAFGEQAKSAKPIIHLGATSCYVTDNAELIQIYDALNVVKSKMLTVMDKLRAFALKYKDLPTLGYTHLQPAQLTTLGKRTTLWLYDLYLDYNDLTQFMQNYKLRGVKGTTGTQASFLSLFDGDDQKVKELEKKVVNKLGFDNVFAVSGQTYTRKFDYSVMSLLSKIAQSAYKFANDVRIMQSFKEVEEPFEKTQIGSSAMAYKRNPMRCERICALARFVESMPINEAVTSSTQWFERTLDDSANKRLTIPQAFLAIDGVLNLYINVTDNMVVYPKVIERRINDELPFMATEEILMECVLAGGDRQELHEAIRQHSMESAKAVKERGENNDLIERIKGDSKFAAVKDKIDGILKPSNFVGMAPQQVTDFISEYIDPLFESENYVPYKPNIKV